VEGSDCGLLPDVEPLSPACSNTGANLSRYMRHINGLYTQYFNRTYKSDGQLFRGRYKSIVIDGDSYLLELVRYIHHNPLNAGLANALRIIPGVHTELIFRKGMKESGCIMICFVHTGGE